MKAGRFDPNRPTVAEVAPLVAALYASRDGGAGCCLHCVLDDGNVDTESVASCLDYARERGHAECVALAEKLLPMSPTQRKRLANER